MTTQSNRPAYGVYHVEEDKGDRKGFWTKIGAAWKHDKGDGFSIQLTTLPIDGRLVVRKLETNEQPERERERYQTPHGLRWHGCGNPRRICSQVPARQLYPL